MNDAEIVALYWERNEDAISQTQQKYGSYLSKIAYNILSDFEDSRECDNDTYLKAWNSMPTHRPNILSTYLGKIARQLHSAFSAIHWGGLLSDSARAAGGQANRPCGWVSIIYAGAA